jgi:hypothetical protein
MRFEDEEELMRAGKTRIHIAPAAALSLAVALALGSALASGAALAEAQAPLVEGAGGAAARPAVVRYLYPEQITIPAGRPSSVALHFRIAPGLHINSHTPTEDELIPTTFSIPASAGVRLDGAVYPPGAEFRPTLDPGTKLSVYVGEFTVLARLVATAGDHLVEARLRYQACDSNACLPPRTITAAIDVIGRRE